LRSKVESDSASAASDSSDEEAKLARKREKKEKKRLARVAEEAAEKKREKKEKKENKRKQKSDEDEKSDDEESGRAEKKTKKAKKSAEDDVSSDKATVHAPAVHYDFPPPCSPFPVCGCSNNTDTWQMSPEAWRAEHEIRITAGGSDCPAPVQRFEDAGFNDELVAAIKAQGFAAPSAIQSQCWPLAMQGRDLIAVAKTGSGKTCGFLFPAFMLIRKTVKLQVKRGDGPVAVALAPTRELAAQIQTECEKFSGSSGIVSTVVYGGVPKGTQIRPCMMGIHVLIATPGRLNDFLAMKNPPVVPLNRLKYLVLDEADRMLDMGFEPQIKEILAAIPAGQQYQSIMFTATWPKAVQALAQQYLKNPVQVNIGTSGEKLTVNKDVTQVVLSVTAGDKDDSLVRELGKLGDKEKVTAMVFANKKYMCDRVATGLGKHGWKAAAIHGDKDQWERSQILKRFAEGKVRVLVATDVAARGLDIQGVSMVINYDFPDNGVEDWVHRVGRTGRAGKKGAAVTFFDTAADRKSARELVGILKGAAQEVPDWLEALPPPPPPPYCCPYPCPYCTLTPSLPSRYSGTRRAATASRAGRRGAAATRAAGAAAAGAAAEGAAAAGAAVGAVAGGSGGRHQGRWHTAQGPSGVGAW